MRAGRELDMVDRHIPVEVRQPQDGGHAANLIAPIVMPPEVTELINGVRPPLKWQGTRRQVNQRKPTMFQISSTSSGLFGAIPLPAPRGLQVQHTLHRGNGHSSNMFGGTTAKVSFWKTLLRISWIYKLIPQSSST